MSQKSSTIAILEALIMIIFLPITLIWIVWKRTDWKKTNKWIATAVVVVVFLLILAASGENKDSENNGSVAVDSQVEVVQQSEEKQNDADLVAPVVSDTQKSPDDQGAETQKAEGEIHTVSHVVDGDTIKLENGKVVRYIGIDTPETVDPRKPVQCFGAEASAKNKQLIEGKEVRLVKDVSETDKYGRILRYVYIGDTFVNDYLVRNGYAHSSTYPPDVKFQDQFKKAEEEARINKRGLWADDACKTETTTPTTTSTTPMPIPVAPTTSNTSGSSNSGATGAYSCNCSKTCPEMISCAEAQYQLNTCGCTRRDADHDGIACDADCQ